MTTPVCSYFVRLLRLMRFEPNNEKVFFNLAMLATDMKQFEDAAKWFQRTIEVARVSSPHLTVSCCS